MNRHAFSARSRLQLLTGICGTLLLVLALLPGGLACARRRAVHGQYLGDRDGRGDRGAVSRRQRDCL